MSFLLRKKAGADERPDLILSEAEAARQHLSRPRQMPRFPGGELQ